MYITNAYYVDRRLSFLLISCQKIYILVLFTFTVLFFISPKTVEARLFEREVIFNKKDVMWENMSIPNKVINHMVNGDSLNLVSIFQADPTIFYHNETYYLYGTKGGNADLGFEVYQSKDLIYWEGPVGFNKGFALVKSDVFGDIGFWAPQVWYENGKFLMAYTANENIAIAVSDSPLGPFKQRHHKPIIDIGKQIDPFIFKDSDGKKYLYHVKLQASNRIFVAELNDDYSGIKKETLKECIAAVMNWENVDNVSWSVVEGPTVIRHGNHYYMFYSANDFRNPKYAVGVAVSDNVYGPWERIGAHALLSIDNTHWSGTGHGDVFKKGDIWYYVCHTHFSEKKVGPRRTAIIPFSFDKSEDRISMPIFNGKQLYHLKTANGR